MAGEKKLRPTRGCGFLSLCGNAFHRRRNSPPRRPSTAPGSSAAARTGAKPAPFRLAPHVRSGDPPARPPWKPLVSPTPPRRPAQAKAQPQRRRPAEPVPTISMELESLLYDHQRSKDSRSLIRASSGNVMLYENLGNLRGRGAARAPGRSQMEDPAKKTREAAPNSNIAACGTADGGVEGRTDQSSGAAEEPAAAATGGSSIVRVPVTTASPTASKGLAPEELNHTGGAEYRKGRFAEALALFEQATAAAPERALYWNNKGVVLTSLGRLLEAVISCREAVRIDPSYSRAHRRLAILYLRLGEPEKSMFHHKQAGAESNTRDMARARSLQGHLVKCGEARKRKDWQNMLKQARFAMGAGADSAPKVFASQAEALLKLQRHQEAETALVDSPTFDVDESTKFFGATTNAYILAVQAQVAMAFVRFDAAQSTAQKAAQIDQRNAENAALARRVKAVSLARKKASDLLKASKFPEACAAYGDGLDRDPQNSVLLSSRAACHCNLEQWEKAIADCNAALVVRPSYKEARLTRADCYAKLEKWEDSIQDYKALVQLLPGDEQVLTALNKAQTQALRERDEGGVGKAASCSNTTDAIENVGDQVTPPSTT